MRELPFGARVAESFVKMLKWESFKAKAHFPAVLPCLCIQEQQRHVRTQGPARRIDFEQTPTVPGVNRVTPPAPSRAVIINERAWVLRFESRMERAIRHATKVLRGRKYRVKTIFEIDGLELHISEEAQLQLKGSTIQVVNDKIVATHGHI